MFLNPGTRLGPYEIVSALGAGGMGEVYRARDTNLNRDVAIKVLPPAVAADPDRLIRFEREARALAALNHPNVASVFAIETSASPPAIVMELVEGQTLSARIAAARLPVPEALAIASQIAEALEAAHERDIVHRDLKPGNIMVREDDRVKVLDFGLAKALEPTGDPTLDKMNSPTLTARATRIGEVLGTAAYMAPEQAKGKSVDKRADVWAFGVVLFEMLAGRRPFDGEDVTDIVTAVIRDDPDWSALPANTPSPIRRLLRRCLTKDVKYRLRDIADARLELEEVAGSRSDIQHVDEAATPERGRHPSWRAVAVAASVIAVAAATVVVWTLTHRTGSLNLAEYDVALPDEAPISFGKGSPWGEAWRSLAISPRGDFLVYIADRGDRTELWYRSLTNSIARPLKNTEGAYQLAISPDGALVAFITHSTVKVTDLAGVTLIELGRAVRPTGLLWRSANQIMVYGDSPPELREFTLNLGSRKIDVRTNCWNVALFDSKRALCSDLAINMVNLDDGTETPVPDAQGLNAPGGPAAARGTAAEFLAPDHLILSSDTGLLIAARWQSATSSISDQTILPLHVRAEGVTGSRQSAISKTGTLAYVPGEFSGLGTLVRKKPTPEATPVALPVEPMVVAQFDIDSTGNRLAVTSHRVDGMALAIHDLTTGRSHVWADRYFELMDPRWSPDGSQLIVRGRKTVADKSFTLVGNPDSSREPQPLSGAPFVPNHWYDATHLIGSAPSLVRVELNGSVATSQKISTGDAHRGMVSPDGQLLAYMFGEDVYVETIDGKTRQRVERGLDPMWLDNRTLMYRDGKKWFKVAIGAGASIGSRAQLFEDGRFIDTINRSHTIAPNGDVIYLRSNMKDTATFIRIVPNWTESAAKAVAAKK